MYRIDKTDKVKTKLWFDGKWKKKKNGKEKKKKCKRKLGFPLFLVQREMKYVYILKEKKIIS